MGVDAARPHRELAAEPEDRRRHLSRVPLPDVRLVGPGPRQRSQRRLRPAPRPAAPVGAGATGALDLGRDLAGHRPAGGRGHGAGRGDLERSRDARRRAERRPGGGVLHLVVQPRQRRVGGDRGPLLRRHRGDIPGFDGEGAGPPRRAAEAGPERRRPRMVALRPGDEDRLVGRAVRGDFRRHGQEARERADLKARPPGRPPRGVDGGRGRARPRPRGALQGLLPRRAGRRVGAVGRGPRDRHLRGGR